MPHTALLENTVPSVCQGYNNNAMLPAKGKALRTDYTEEKKSLIRSTEFRTGWVVNGFWVKLKHAKSKSKVVSLY